MPFETQYTIVQYADQYGWDIIPTQAILDSKELMLPQFKDMY